MPNPNTGDGIPSPGPWTVDAGLGLKDEGMEILDANRRPVVASCILAGVMRQADATLIAASPELRDVLVKAYKQSSCDGDLCAYAWHEEARELFARLGVDLG